MRTGLIVGLFISIFHGGAIASPARPLRADLYPEVAPAEYVKIVEFAPTKKDCVAALASPFADYHHVPDRKIAVRFAAEVTEAYGHQPGVLDFIAEFLARHHRMALDLGQTHDAFELLVSQPLPHRAIARFRLFFEPAQTDLYVESLRMAIRGECAEFWRQLSAQERIPMLTYKLPPKKFLRVPEHPKRFKFIQVSPGVRLKLAFLNGIGEEDLRAILALVKEIRAETAWNEKEPENLRSFVTFRHQQLQVQIGIMDENLFLKTIYDEHDQTHPGLDADADVQAYRFFHSMGFLRGRR